MACGRLPPMESTSSAEAISSSYVGPDSPVVGAANIEQVATQEGTQTRSYGHYRKHGAVYLPHVGRAEPVGGIGGGYSHHRVPGKSHQQHPRDQGHYAQRRHAEEGDTHGEEHHNEPQRP